MPAAMEHVEDREFVLRLEVRCTFPEGYEGDEDGYAWAEEVPALAAEVVRAARAALARHPRWRLRTANRGRPTDEEITLVLERVLSSEAAAERE